MPIISLSLSSDIISEINELASSGQRSKSQVVREAVVAYSTKSRWKKIREEGDQIAKRLGIESDDDVELLFG